MSSSELGIPHSAFRISPVSVRAAEMSDVPFMDALQKKYGRALGYFPLKQFEGYVKAGHVLVAEEVRGQKSEVSEGGVGGSPRLTSDLRPLTSASSPLGYLISKDRYLKRDELGVIFQLCVAPGAQRKLVGAELVRAAFERSAYGCRLYCCWCAQDLEANRFWESMGFVPLAFRVGGTGSASRKKGGRIHIFWQRRIVAGDAETKWWYPFQTSGGALRADRVVLPIPPGVHWSEVKAPELGAAPPAVARGKHARISNCKSDISKRKTGKTAAATGPGPGRVGILVGGRIKYVDKPGHAAFGAAVASSVPLLPAPEKPKRPKRDVTPMDPKFLAKVRELRDRYLEHVNGGDGLPNGAGKYDPSRTLGGGGGTPALAPGKVKLLPRAA